MLITRDDIQRIGDEDTLLHFLGEKLNLPIQEEATLEQIALPLPLPFLGLDEPIVGQIKDFRDLSGNPKNALGKRRPFLIQFKSRQSYADILRDVAKNLNQKYADPADIFFICVAQNFQPFAFAYFNNSPTGDWHTASLNILAWTQENTYIHTSSEHDLPIGFFPDKSLVEDDAPKDNQEDNQEFEVEDDYSEKSVISGVSEDSRKPASLESQDKAPPNYIAKQTSSEDLLAKLEKTGTRLVEYWNIHQGISTGCDTAFLINESKSQQLIREDAQSSVLIKSRLRPVQKWEGVSDSLICIPNSRDKSWAWSTSESESEADEIFAENYPAIRKHLKGYGNLLHKPKYKGKFYWEWPSSKLYSGLKQPKIVYPYNGNSMQACYDCSESVVLSPAFFIPTEDLSLLAILNSELFNWYTQVKYEEKINSVIEFKQDRIGIFPVAMEREDQKAEISLLVEQILGEPNSPEVPDIETEIDEWIYNLYDLTTTEIALIKGEPYNA